MWFGWNEGLISFEEPAYWDHYKWMWEYVLSVLLWGLIIALNNMIAYLPDPVLLVSGYKECMAIPVTLANAIKQIKGFHLLT